MGYPYGVGYGGYGGYGAWNGLGWRGEALRRSRLMAGVGTTTT